MKKGFCSGSRSCADKVDGRMRRPWKPQRKSSRWYSKCHMRFAAVWKAHDDVRFESLRAHCVKGECIASSVRNELKLTENLNGALLVRSRDTNG